MISSRKDTGRHITARHYIGFWLPIYIFFIGFFLKITGSANAFFAASAFATAGAMLGAYLMVFRLKEVRFSWAMGIGLILGYAGGALNTDLGLLKDGTNVAEFTGHLQEDISYALTIALWVSAALLVSGAFLEKPIRLNFAKLIPADIRLVWCSLAVILAAFARGSFGYMGTHYSDDFHVSPLSEFAGMLCPTLPAMTIFLQPKNPAKWQAVMLYSLLLAEFLMILPTGRRTLIYSLVVTIFAVNLRETKLRLSLRKRLLLLVCACLVVYPGMKFFFAMRVMTWRAASAKEANVLELAKGAYTLLSEGDSSFEQAYDQNVKTRTSIITYLTDMLAANRTYTPLYGKDLLFCFKFVIPSAFYPDKSEVLMMEEEVTNPQFGLPVEDDANSVLTTGIADFGLAGCFLYPLIVPLIFNYFVRLIQRRTVEPAAVFAMTASLILLLQAEISGTGCTGLWRDLVMMTILIVCVRKIPFWKVDFLQKKPRARVFLRRVAYADGQLPLPPVC